MSDTSTLPTAPTGPVQNPTWYADIRGLFNSTDISSMKSHGIDLSSYDDVVSHAGNIYQQVAQGNMPCYGAWLSDKVGTFGNWMDAGYPKGTPSSTQREASFMAAQSFAPDVRVRKEIGALTPDEIAALKKAFIGLMARDPSDSSSYFAQAGIHWYPAPNTFCMHHVPGYNPWHRAYLLGFEDALRSVDGCGDVTLPYWDITTPVPDVFDEAPFNEYKLQAAADVPDYPEGYVTQRNPHGSPNDPGTIEYYLKQYQVFDCIDRAMKATDWDDFHGLIGLFPTTPNNAIIHAHDMGHNSIGPTMQDQGVAAFDPIFWFFHCNWDRLFWKWQTQMHATDLNGLMSTISKTKDPLSYQIFTDPAMEKINPFSQPPLDLTTTSVIDSVGSLKVGYADPLTPPAPTALPRTKVASLASEKAHVDPTRVNVAIKGINRLKIPGSFNVHLLKDGEPIAMGGFFQPTKVETCETCVENAIVRFDFELPLETVLGGKLDVAIEPLVKRVEGGYLPKSAMGTPTIEVNLLMNAEQ